jgi:tetraacyldisaccharide-1-P 4'-kinase
MSTIFKDINNLPFDDNEKADLFDFFTNRDMTRVETVLLATEKDEVKVNYLRKHAKSLRGNYLAP